MKNSLTIVVAVVIVLILIGYMFMYQVRYDEVAIVSTFGQADESSVVREAGLGFRVPPPIQKVYKLTTRTQILEDELVEQQTRDGSAVILQAYLTWRIKNPLEFFRKLKDIHSDTGALAPLLTPLLRSDLRGIVSQYDFKQLVNTDPNMVMLPEIERKARAQIQGRVEEQGYGLEIVQVGLSRILLPQAVTDKVFERMKETRFRMAADARASGRAEADHIRSEAELSRSRILAFAERRAQALRAEGDYEASSYYTYFNKNPELAIFLKLTETLSRALRERSTYVLSASQLGLENVLTPLVPKTEVPSQVELSKNLGPTEGSFDGAQP